MAYPKPLSAKSIDKMFSSWEPHVVKVLHTYYAAFANLYGSIQLKDAWKIFKRFEPKIHKKQFVEFSSIVRREDVHYCIFEIDELYCDERRNENERFIVNKELIADGYGKYGRVYKLHELQIGKPYYNKPDLLEVAKHRNYDKELGQFVNKMIFTEGEQKGKRFDEAVFLTKEEEFIIGYYKSETKKQKIKERALIPFSEKLIKYLQSAVEFADNPIVSISKYLEDVGYIFESKKQAVKFFKMLADYMNNSHLWRNGGFTPYELRSMAEPGLPKTISLGPGIKKAIEEGQLNRDEIYAKFKEMGIDVVN